MKTSTYRNGDRVRVSGTTSGIYDGVTGTVIRRSENDKTSWYWVRLDKSARKRLTLTNRTWLGFHATELEFEDNARYLETFGDLLGRVGDYVLIPQYLTCEGIRTDRSLNLNEHPATHHAFRLTKPLRYGQMTDIHAECPDCTGEISNIPRDHITKVMLMCDKPERAGDALITEYADVD